MKDFPLGSGKPCCAVYACIWHCQFLASPGLLSVSFTTINVFGDVFCDTDQAIMAAARSETPVLSQALAKEMVIVYQYRHTFLCR